MVSIPRRKQTDNYDWKSLPEGRYLIEWYERGKRRREADGITAAEALDAVSRKKHQLERKALGIAGEVEQEEPKRRPLDLAVKRYLDVVEALKKPNTLRKYRAVLERFSEFFTPATTPQSITPDDLNQFMVHLKKDFEHDNNTSDLHILDKCKVIARRAGLKIERFDLKTFRSTYATRMLRAGFDPRTVQHWMGHTSLETTMRYLSPSRGVHDRLNRVDIAGVLNIVPKAE